MAKNGNFPKGLNDNIVRTPPFHPFLACTPPFLSIFWFAISFFCFVFVFCHFWHVQELQFKKYSQLDLPKQDSCIVYHFNFSFLLHIFLEFQGHRWKAHDLALWTCQWRSSCVSCIFSVPFVHHPDISETLQKRLRWWVAQEDMVIFLKFCLLCGLSGYWSFSALQA